MNVSVNEVLGSVNSLLPKKAQLYISGLLMTEGKKSCTRMGLQMDITHDKVYRCLDLSKLSPEQQQNFFLQLVHRFATKENPGHLCGDDTCLSRFSTSMEGAGHMHSSIEERVVTGQCPVVLCWSNGDITIPIAWDFWLPMRWVGKDKYRTKIQIMQDLIKQVVKRVPFSYILLDGLYQSDEMMSFCDDWGIKFLMRLPRNRLIRLSETSPGIKIRDHWAYRLSRNLRSKAFTGYLNGKDKLRHIAAEKRKNSSGDYETVYLISNFQKAAKEYISIYLLRWDIEQLFRTSKQSLGLGDCQAVYLKIQRAHIFLVFAAFAIADSIKYLNKFSCTGDGIRYLKDFILDMPQISKRPTDGVSCAIA